MFLVVLYYPLFLHPYFPRPKKRGVSAGGEESQEEKMNAANMSRYSVEGQAVRETGANQGGEMEAEGAGGRLSCSSTFAREQQSIRPVTNDDARRYRASPFIVESILGVARQGAKKSTILSVAKLSNRQTDHFLKYCLTADLIAVREEVGSKHYFTTTKGVRYLELIAGLRVLSGLDKW